MGAHSTLDTHARLLRRAARFIGNHLNWRYVLTSHVRNDATTHRTGRAMDMAFRSGPLGQSRLAGHVDYFTCPALVEGLYALMAPIAQHCPNLSHITVEIDHLHLEVETDRAPPTLILSRYNPGTNSDLAHSTAQDSSAFTLVRYNRSTNMNDMDRLKDILARGSVKLSGPPSDIALVTKLVTEAGGPYADESAEDGGPEELGGEEIGARPRLFHKPKRRGQLTYQHPQAPSIAGNPSNVSTVVRKDADIRRYGLRFLREAGCTLTLVPIPIEARTTPAAAAHALRQSQNVFPRAPIVSSATVLALPTFARLQLPLPAVAGDRDEHDFFALRLDFGLQGAFAPAGSPVNFDVYSNITGAPDPAAGTPGEINGFASGPIQLTPYRSFEAFSIVMLFWQVVSTIPHPRVWKHYADNAAYYAAARRNEMDIRINAAPLNTQLTATLLTPVHPSWQKMLEELAL